METAKPVINGNMDTVEKAERIINWIDDILLEYVADTAAKFDHIQQGLTLASGTIVKRIGDRLKKELQRIGRYITKVQKTLDYNQLSSRSDVSATSQQLDEMMNGHDIPLEDISTGTLPTSGQDQSSQTSSGNLDPLVDQCPPGAFRTNPVTCEYENCLEGVWVGTGVFDKKCQDQNTPPPPPPPPPPPNGNGNNWFDIYCPTNVPTYGRRYNLDLVENVPPINPVYPVQTQLSPDVAVELRSFKRFYEISPKDNISRPADFLDDGVNSCGDPVQTVVTMPYQRNSEERINIYTSEGENWIRERWGNSQLYSDLTNYPTIESWANARWPRYDGDNPDGELIFPDAPDLYGT